MSPRALVVDDDPDLAELVERVLAASGYEVRVVTEAAEVPAALAEHQPGLVTLDLSLPGVHGTELLSAVRTGTSAHVVVVTGHVLAGEALAEVHAAGADDVLTKPFPLRELRDRALALRPAETGRA
jgi:two-component system, OmpR family, response regulator